jgi:hypothetical protein
MNMPARAISRSMVMKSRPLLLMSSAAFSVVDCSGVAELA